MSNNPTVLEIDSKAVIHNLNYFKSHIQSTTKLLVVIKALAYGSDSVAIAKLLEDQNIDYLAVAYADEGVDLRKAKIKLPILVLHPQIENFDKIIAYDLEPNLYNFRSLDHFLKLVKKNNRNNYHVHIKLDTGLNRLGFKENDLNSLKNKLQSNLVKVVSVFSHLSSSEDPNELEFTENQISLFEKITEKLTDSLNYSFIKHLSNTSGIINYPKSHFDMVRLGIGLYGFANNVEDTAKLKNVCSLKTKISHIQTIKKGESVSYNRNFVANKSSKIGVIPIGYADGLIRILGRNVGFVYIKNKRIPIIGNMCMDITMLDLSGVDCSEGDEVIIFNSQDHILEFAKKASTIQNEILTSISQRVKRIII